MTKEITSRWTHTVIIALLVLLSTLGWMIPLFILKVLLTIFAVISVIGQCAAYLLILTKTKIDVPRSIEYLTGQSWYNSIEGWAMEILFVAVVAWLGWWFLAIVGITGIITGQVWSAYLKKTIAQQEEQ